jgi:hypothetical protein
MLTRVSRQHMLTVLTSVRPDKIVSPIAGA